VSKYRPKAPIIAVTPSEHVMRALQLVWGVIPVLGTPAKTTDEMFDIAVNGAIRSGLVKLGDTVVITAGVPVGRSGSTNLIKIHTVGDLVAKGQGIGSQSATGKVVVAHTPEEAIAKAQEGMILVTPSTNRDYMPAIEKAAALITESGGITSHAAVVGLNLGIPVVLGVADATQKMKDGMEVTVYAEIGVIYTGQARVL